MVHKKTLIVPAAIMLMVLCDCAICSPIALSDATVEKRNPTTVKHWTQNACEPEIYYRDLFPNPNTKST